MIVTLVFTTIDAALSIANLPNSKLRRMSAWTTPSVSAATCSRMRAEAAPWLPLTARKAFVIATEILPGSNPTTAPLRRITRYWPKRGSRACDSASTDSIATLPGVATSLAVCIKLSP